MRHRLVLHGALDKGDDVLATVREFGSPLLVGLQPMPYSVLQSAFDALYPNGLQWYWKADFFTEITDEAIGAAGSTAPRSRRHSPRCAVDPDPANLPQIT
jgi:hypothetical protein